MKDTKNNIMNTAFKMLLKYGYDKVSVNAVVNTIGISKGAFYHYFTGKEELVMEIADAYIINEFSNAEQIFAEKKSAKKKIKLLYDVAYSMWSGLMQVMDYEEESSSFLVLMIQMKNRFPQLKKKLIDSYNEMISAVEKIIKAGKAEGAIKASVKPAATALNITAQIEGLMLLQSMEVLKGDSMEKVLKQAFEYTWKSLENK